MRASVSSRIRAISAFDHSRTAATSSSARRRRLATSSVEAAWISSTTVFASADRRAIVSSRELSAAVCIARLRSAMSFVGRRAAAERCVMSIMSGVTGSSQGSWLTGFRGRGWRPHRPAGRFRSAPPSQGSLKPGLVSVWAIGSASSIGERRGSTRHPRLGRIVAAGVGVVQSAGGTSGPRRWYRRALRAVPGYHGRDGCHARPAIDGPGPTDTLGRAMRDLRISVTDRCNFRCTYCMPKEIFGKDYAFLPRDQVLSFEEIERIARIFVGARRREAPDHRRRAARPARPARPDRDARGASAGRTAASIDLTLTTNGSALRALAGPLADAGLRRVTVSLDSLDDAVFGAMNGIDFPVARVLDGIDAAIEAGLAPVKVNMVVRRGDQRDEHRADGALGARDRA